MFPLVRGAAGDSGFEAALLESTRHFPDDSRALHRQRRGGDPGARVRVDRAEALAALYRGLPPVRAGVLITGAMELLGRVVRDIPLIVAAREASRPTQRSSQRSSIRMGNDEHQSVWRSAIVALGLMGVAPIDADVRAAAGSESHDQAAVALGAALADPEGAGSILEALERNAVGGAVGATALARRRLALGRLMTVVG